MSSKNGRHRSLDTVDISDEILVSSVAVESLITGVGKIVDLERLCFLFKVKLCFPICTQF